MKEIKITCKECGIASNIQVIPKKSKLYPKYCPKCSHHLDFVQRLKNRSMWILTDIHDRIKSHFLIQNQNENRNRN